MTFPKPITVGPEDGLFWPARTDWGQQLELRLYNSMEAEMDVCCHEHRRVHYTLCCKETGVIMVDGE